MATPSAYCCQMPLFPHNFMVPVVAPIAAPTMMATSAVMMPRWPAAQTPVNVHRACVGNEASAPSQQVLMQRLQKDAATLEQSRAALIAKSALKLSRDHEGCRLVQQALEEAETDEARSALVETLRGHVWEVAMCPHANHVLQKYIVTMKPAACQFIVDELTRQGPGNTCKLARHKFGYRVFQRLLEHLMPQQTVQLIDWLMTECVSLSMHRFGNYVMQHILEYGTDAQKEQVIAGLVPQIGKLCMNNDACMVLDAALVKADEDIQDVLVQAILGSDGAIGAMAHTRRGHVVVLSLLELVGGEFLEGAKRQLAKQAPSLRKNRFGRAVLKSVELYHGNIVAGAVGGA